MNRDRLIAHRGYQRHYPENTLPAMEAAIQAGAVRIETDVQLSRDGIPMLFHDRTLERQCGERGAIHDYSASQLCSFSAHEPERLGDSFRGIKIATLDQLVSLLTLHKGVTAYIEIKRASVEKHGLAITVETIMATLKPVRDRCVLISFSPDAIGYAWEHGYPRLGLVLEAWEQHYSSMVKNIQPEILFINHLELPEGRAIHLPETPLAVYEVDEQTLAQKLFNRGVDYVETFAIGELLETLGHNTLSVYD